MTARQRIGVEVPFPEVIKRGLELPDGANSIRCALQVNPWAYIEREEKATRYDNEISYHTAIVDACLSNGIGAIAVTDHHAVMTSAPLLQLASASGIAAYPGFEARARDGVHLLCIFDPSEDLHEIDRRLGELRVTAAAGPSELASLDTVHVLEHMGMGMPRTVVRGMRAHHGTDPLLTEDGERFTVTLLR